MSSKRLFPLLIIFLSLILATASPISALKEDFAAYTSKETVSACACDLVENHVFVQNTGDITSTYFLETLGEASGWSNHAPDTFYLEKGERKEVLNYLNIPCSARGEYDLQTSIRTLFDYEKSMTQKLEVDNCANVQLVQRSGTQNSCPCSPITYEFEVFNTGEHTESYRINVTPYADSISVSDPILILEPGESQLVYAFINLPCQIHGDQKFTLNVLAEGTGILGELDFDLLIDSCYDYRIETADEYNICVNVPNTIPVEITNIVDIANQYTLTVDGPLWARFDNNTKFAWGKQTTTANLILEPKDEDFVKEEKNVFQININGVTERGRLEESKNITVTVENCYDLNIVLQEQDSYGIKETDKNYGFLIENSGTKEANYSMEIIGPEWAELVTDPNVALSPGQTQEFSIFTHIPQEAEGQQTINIIGTVPEYGVVRENVLNIDPIAIEDAYNLDISVKDRKISTEGDVFDIPVKNLGVFPADYTATIIAPSWVLAENTQFNLVPGENTSIIINALPPEDTVLDTYLITVEATPEETGLIYTTSFNLKVGEKPWWSWFSDHWLLTVLAASILLLLLVVLTILIVRRRKEEDTKEKKVELEKVGAGQKEKKGRWWIIPLIALLLLALLAGAWLAWTSFAPAPTGDNETAVEPMTEQAVISDSLGLITIDRTAIPGEGNVLEVDRPGQLILEMEISNPTDDNIIFNLAANDEESWLSIPNDELYITPKGKNTAQLIITPDMDKLRSEDYTVNVTVSIRGGGLDYQQDIPLTISKKKDFFDTWWFWLLIGLLVAASLVLLTAGLRRLAAGRKKEGSYYEQVPEKDTFEGPRERNLWKWAFIILIGAILLGALIAGGLFLWNDMKRETVLSETPVEPVPNKEPISLAPAEPAQQEAIVEVDLSGLSGKGNTIVVENNETLIIPMTVMNPSDESVVFIAVTSDDTWITVEEPQMELAPHSSEGTYVWITPDMDLLKKKDYTVGINTTLEGATVDYTQSLDFDITEPRSIFNSIWFYMLLGVLIAVLIIWLISRDREKKEEEYENYFSHDEPEETEKPKKKTNKRTKIGLKKK